MTKQQKVLRIYKSTNSYSLIRIVNLFNAAFFTWLNSMI